MPIYACSNGKFRIGEGECVYTSRENAESAYRAYLAEEGQKEETIKNDNTTNKNMIYNYKSFGLEVKDVDAKSG